MRCWACNGRIFSSCLTDGLTLPDFLALLAAFFPDVLVAISSSVEIFETEAAIDATLPHRTIFTLLAKYTGPGRCNWRATSRRAQRIIVTS